MLFTSGCNPTFDWRAYYDYENNWQAFFPGKTFKKKRNFDLLIDGVPTSLSMTQNSTKINKMVFTIDCSELTNNKVKTSQLSKYLISSLEKNFKLKNKKKINKNIYIYSGVFPASKKPVVKIKLMTLIHEKEDFVIRGIVYGEHENFLHSEAMFFLNSIK